MNFRLRAELWEVQMLLMWILSFMLIHYSTTWLGTFLGWALVVWSFVTFIGIQTILVKGRAEEKASK